MLFFNLKHHTQSRFSSVPDFLLMNVPYNTTQNYITLMSYMVANKLCYWNYQSKLSQSLLINLIDCFICFFYLKHLLRAGFPLVPDFINEWGI